MGLCCGSTSSPPRPVKVRSVLQKEAVFGVGQGDGSSVSVNGGQVYRKGQWGEEAAATRGHHGRRRKSQKYKEEKMESRLRLSTGAQDPSTTMRELIIQGNIASVPISWSVSKKDSSIMSLI